MTNKIAIISDIHSNLEALEVVLRDIESKNVEMVYCLGDVIGYGPNPRECLLKVMICKIVLKGNHEDALMMAPQGAEFNIEAGKSIDWTRSQLDFKKFNRDETAKIWNFIGDMKDYYIKDNFFYVHGSPRGCTREYIHARDIHDSEKMDDIFSMFDHVCFCGHTHEPGVITEDREFIFPKLVNYTYEIPTDKKCVINVGSVGQPRDKDPRACYATFDGKTISWHRLNYDFQTTMRKIFNIRELHHKLAIRLKEGR